MVRLPFRSSRSSSSQAVNTPSASDTQSIRSEASDWTTVSTARTVTNADLDDPENVSLSIHSLASGDGLIAKITPPTAPLKPIAHVPCDIVLVIDVSGSMGCDAPIPSEAGQAAENYGLSVLDLVKHAARTILSTLDAGDRLGIVTFAAKVTVLQGLEIMDPLNKKAAEKNIASMQPANATNLWHGILQGIKLFKQGGETGTGRVPAIMVLTDGLPNYMCPPQGYVPKIRSMEELPASIHTFGFGYQLRSGLLKSIAEIGGGNYSFIPDAGMIGTVFVHAVANLQATYATSATLRLVYPASLELEETTGKSVDQQEAITLIDEPNKPKQLSIALGNLQYGQSRDIYLKISGDTSKKLTITATLEYSRMTNTIYKKSASQLITDTTTLPEAEIAYHLSRSQICSLLSSIFPLREDGEHEPLKPIPIAILDRLKALTAEIPAKKHPSDPKNKSLLEDLSAPEPKGQITLAITNHDFYYKWGQHYLPSLLNAHTRQICNSFKDPGPLQYGIDSPLFISCRDKLDKAFDYLPAPTPSNKSRATHHGYYSMSSYNNSAGVCFAGSTKVLLADGQERPISKLTNGTVIRTPLGQSKVSIVLRTRVKNEIMCRVGDVIVTPWHPICLQGSDEIKEEDWSFPADVTTSPPVIYTGYIYSILLEQDSNIAAHALYLGSQRILGVTLGHTSTIPSQEDVRAHSFFGDHVAVSQALNRLGINKRGIVNGSGVKRDPITGLVTGFTKAKVVLEAGAKGRMAITRRKALGRMRVRRASPQGHVR